MARAGMKMADLTRESGVSTASIKFYLREGLLQAGARTAPNQAVYDDSHIRRLKLIRALRDVGGLSISSIRNVVEAVGQPAAGDLMEIIGTIADAFGETRRAPDRPSAGRAAAALDIDAFLERARMPVRPGSTAREALISGLLAFREYEPRFPAFIFEPYAEALRGLAAWEISQVAPTPTNLMATLGEQHPLPTSITDEETIEGIIYGTMLFEPIILALRRLLHENFAVSGVQAGDLPPWAPRFMAPVIPPSPPRPSADFAGEGSQYSPAPGATAERDG